MKLPKRYQPEQVEPALLATWETEGVYHFSPRDERPVYSIDTPPPTVSGLLHLGHVYSYSQADFIARFRRMQGYNVFYPMGYDDNGLPTDRLVEKQLGVTAEQVGRKAFITECLEISASAEAEYQALWRRIGLSVDWRHTYRTIDPNSQHIAQWSFLDLHRKGLTYRREAPTIWCPECHTAIAQADVIDLERQSTFYTLAFKLSNGASLPIATTRPELLPACVAIFVHPDDERFRQWIGGQATVPFADHIVPILADPGADPAKGTGAVMCCTFGDQADVGWWFAHQLPLRETIGRDGRMTDSTHGLSGLTVPEARRQVIEALESQGSVLNARPVEQSIRAHERCDTPVEYVLAQQWFIRLLDFKSNLQDAGHQINWYPEHMANRYQVWVENLAWDWCISRQRAFGIPIPVWYCADCGNVLLAAEDQLPVDPQGARPPDPCECGSRRFTAEEDVFDTWATSSLTPQIVGGWSPPTGADNVADSLYTQVFPFTLRPQAHEIIRTWTFYTIAKSTFHFAELPWQDVFISGWGVAGEGMGKISKSRGGGPMVPLEVIDRYSADAVRYWAASTGPGKDAIISEEKIRTGARLVTKLWNVALFSQPFLQGYSPDGARPDLSPADRWILSGLQTLVQSATDHFLAYEYAAVKSEVEAYFWRQLADNYLEMVKQRLYDTNSPTRAAAMFTLQRVLLTLLKLFAPFLPFVTDTIYRGLFANSGGHISIHRSSWPAPDPSLIDHGGAEAGERLVTIAIAVRRFKSASKIPLSVPIKRLQLATEVSELAQMLQAAQEDLSSITRAQHIEVKTDLDPNLIRVADDGTLSAAVEP